MICRCLRLADGQEVAFCLQQLAPGESYAIDAALPVAAKEPALELFSQSSGGDSKHPDFVGARYLVAGLLDPTTAAAYKRRGLPLKAANGRVKLSPEDSVWLLTRLAAGTLDEVEVTRAPRTRPSALAGLA